MIFYIVPKMLEILLVLPMRYDARMLEMVLLF